MCIRDRHAARRADELDELAHWLASEERDAAWATTARDVLRRFAALGLDGERRWTFAEALAAFAAEKPDAAEPDGDDSSAAKP